MSEHLSAETIARMKADHVEEGRPVEFNVEPTCFTCGMLFPCSTALLLAELERRAEDSLHTHPIGYASGHFHDDADVLKRLDRIEALLAHPRHDG